MFQDGWHEVEEEKPKVFQFGNQLPVKTRGKPQMKASIGKIKMPVRVKTDKQGSAGPGKYKHFCVVCKKVFQLKLHLEDHYRSKHGAPKLQCQYCPKTFAVFRSLQRHTPLHTGKFPFHCSQCNAGFNLRRELQAHENKHQGRGYTCLKCNKVFYAEKDLFMHQEKCVKP